MPISNLPTFYMPNLTDPKYLDRYRHNTYILATGDLDPCKDANERMAAILRAKHIPCRLDIWGNSTGHVWPCWQKILQHYRLSSAGYSSAGAWSSGCTSPAAVEPQDPIAGTHFGLRDLTLSERLGRPFIAGVLPLTGGRGAVHVLPGTGAERCCRD